MLILQESKKKNLITLFLSIEIIFYFHCEFLKFFFYMNIIRQYVLIKYYFPFLIVFRSMVFFLSRSESRPGNLGGFQGSISLNLLKNNLKNLKEKVLPIN